MPQNHRHEPSHGDDRRYNSLTLIANIHYLIGIISFFLVAITLPLLIGTLLGIGLIGQPGTGTSVAARGPVINYLQSTGAFPESGPVIELVKFLRTVTIMALLLMTGVGLEYRLRSAWYTVVALYLLFTWSVLGNIVAVGFGLLVVGAAMYGRPALNTNRSLSEEISVLQRAIGHKLKNVRQEISES